MENKQVKRSLDSDFANEAKKHKTDMVGQLEHCMMNYYRENHERQVDMKEAWKKRSEILEERASRLHRHGLQMCNTVETQASMIQTLREHNERLERDLYIANIARAQLRKTIQNIIEEDIPEWVERTREGLNEYLQSEINFVDDDSTITDVDLTTEEIQEVIDLTTDDELPAVEQLNIQWPRGNI